MAKKIKTPTMNVKTLILSVIVAVILWVTVTYIADPDMQTTLTDVEVHFVGESALHEKELTITGKSEVPLLSVVVSGKKSDLIKYMDDIYVEVNVSDVSKTGTFKLPGTISLPTTRITVVKEKYGDIPVEVEERVKKDLPIKVKQTGSRKGTVVKSEPAQSSVEITGAKSEVEQIAAGLVTIDISEMTEGGTRRMGYALTDSAGNLVSRNETIETKTAEIDIQNTIYPSKSVEIIPVLSAELSKLYILDAEKTTVSPATITVGIINEEGDDKVTVMLDNAGESYYTLQSTANVYIPSDSTIAKVKPVLLKKETATIDIPVTGENLSEGLTAEIPNVNATVFYKEGTADKIKATVDLKNLSEGEYNLPVTISGDSLTAKEVYHIKVVIKSK